MLDIPLCLQYKAKKKKLRRFPRLSYSHLCSRDTEWWAFKVHSWSKLYFVITRGYGVGNSVSILKVVL